MLLKKQNLHGVLSDSKCYLYENDELLILRHSRVQCHRCWKNSASWFTGFALSKSVRAVSLETLVSVTAGTVPGFLGFGKRTENQNEVPISRKRTKKSLILEKSCTLFVELKKNVEANFVILVL